MSASDDDVPTLSAEALKALNEFYHEQEEERSKLERVQNNLKDCDISAFQENWQLSQFWYDNSTIEALTSEICKISRENGRIALISCPSLYKSLKSKAKNREVILFEYDKRFAMYGLDYNFYDYNSPLDVPRELAGYFDVVVADPPFLSEDCITKTAVTIKFFTKSKIILCTGAVMEELVGKLLNLKKSSFEPKHENNLANEFCCYTNYNNSFK
ncbi:unnamed protein product [Nezara viridula]|uniref:Protein-lysine N-methyltransferase NEZAVI_LOCUS6241 n=1 Tax=Nezara viridula TaxID=85310 RepID=A0A9P0H635_NEZVI|nr:unnamed protein product [Nezara viridula]